MIYNRLCHYFSLPPLTPPPRRRGPQAATFRPLFLFWHTLERPVNVPRLTSACERPSSSAPIANECPVRFFSGRHGGLPLQLDEKRRFYTPQLHFRCISNTLQRYEKFLKLTNYKHKTFKKLFVGAAILLCIKQLQKLKSKILITNDLRHFHRPYLPHSFLPVCVTRYRLQFFYEPIIRREAWKIAKYVSKNIYYYIYNIYILYINSKLYFPSFTPFIIKL